MRIGIIGAGVFGCSSAIELSKKGFEVVIFDRHSNILEGASTINHLRHHYGFHYPRSKDTVQEIKIARKSFEEEYSECVSDFFDDYYGCSKINTKTTPENFIKFCDEMVLEYEQKWPEEEYMDKENIGVCVKTPERVYDPDILKGLILKRMKNLDIKLRLNHKVTKGEKTSKKKKLMGYCGEAEFSEEFDFIINATYSNFNSFNGWFGFPKKKLQYELVELLELYIPDCKKIGLTIMDGEFSSVLPRGEKGTFTLGHVRESVLKAIISDNIDPVVMSSENLKSNKERILKEGIKDFPFLKKAVIVNSLYVTRVVKPDVEDTDERPSEITDYGDGLYSIFGGKIITCVEIGRKIVRMINESIPK